jgi:hypothetical protein
MELQLICIEWEKFMVNFVHSRIGDEVTDPFIEYNSVN